MSNCSEAFGSITLVGNWSDDTIKDLLTVFGEASDWYYAFGIDNPDDLFSDSRTARFTGTGKWTFQNSLENFGEWFHKYDNGWEVKVEPARSINRAYKKLIDSMEKNGLAIQFDYSDHEAGCSVLYTQKGSMSTSGGRLSYSIGETTEFERTWANVHKLGFERGTFEDFAWMLERKLKEMSVEPCRDKIRDWITDNTRPCFVWSFDELHHEKQSHFLKTFAMETKNILPLTMLLESNGWSLSVNKKGVSFVKPQRHPSGMLAFFIDIFTAEGNSFEFRAFQSCRLWGPVFQPNGAIVKDELGEWKTLKDAIQEVLPKFEAAQKEFKTNVRDTEEPFLKWLPPKQPDQKYNGTPDGTTIIDLDLSWRTHNTLIRAEINTIGDLLRLKHFDEIPHFEGRKLREEVCEKMQKLGYGEWADANMPT